MKIFITGIDTGVGKTFFTGMLANELLKCGRKVITCKLVQTGCVRISEDILTHRKLMGINLLAEDIEGKTCPYVFSFPSSPHLAAAIDGKEVNIALIDENIESISKNYEIILIEGAGGICVPLKKDLLIIDWVSKRQLDVIVVSTPRLGSINHTILTVETLRSRKVKVLGIFYNTFFRENERITEDSFNFFRSYFPQLIVSNNVKDFISIFGM